ncbi:unnamed protein product [Clonostachys rosea f. rosea IK726]|uniref:Uncharacterized protein n=1 Tax=Clonostachys rosea f. rosea IK726 TaxID=1349383 RepID=A0ACA9UFJ6_BIOOC|nr:unnamed protein product [Clonostachys rosea f. rosea IK726]
MRLSQSVLLASLATLAMAAKDTEPSPSRSCSGLHSNPRRRGSYFDLRPDIAWPEDSGKAHSKAQHKDYYARGWDYGKNFTLNICNSVVSPVTDVVGVSKSQWANVSAYYTSQGNIYSIGSQSWTCNPVAASLFYSTQMGSPCGKSKSKSKSKSSPRSADSVYDDEEALKKQHAHEVETYDKADDPKDRKKSTTISFLCDRDVANTHLAVSFVGTDPDECAYFFEARSHHACAFLDEAGTRWWWISSDPWDHQPCRMFQPRARAVFSMLLRRRTRSLHFAGRIWTWTWIWICRMANHLSTVKQACGHGIARPKIES